MTQQTPPAYVPPQPLSQSDERLWGTLIPIGGILIGFISPLIGYLVLKDRSPFVKETSRQALNFQITLAIAQVVGLILAFVLIGLLGIVAAYILNIVFSVLAASPRTRARCTSTR